MNIKEAKETYEGLKKNAFIVESIDKEFFLKFGEIILNELDNKDKEIKEKIEWLREISDNGANAVRFAATHDDEIERIQKQKDISTMIGILQELLKESD